MLEELADREKVSKMGFLYSSNNVETKLGVSTGILPRELSRDIFLAISDLTELRKYLDQGDRKYKFSQPKLDNYGI